MIGAFMSSSHSHDALHYHQYPTPGKIKTVPSKPVDKPKDLALAYTPGVAKACQEIFKNEENSFLYTGRRKLIAVISNGTAVLGLGDIGAAASKPVMEGKAMLFQKFGGLQSIDIEISEKDPKKLVEIIASLEPTFGGINLEDIKAPECFYVEDTLKERMNIPVFHDDQHGTAVVVSAVVLNALHIVQKNISDIRCVVSGAGASALSCLRLLRHMGLPRENILVTDSVGVIHHHRTDLSHHKKEYAHETPHRTLADAVVGADLFLGLSKKGLLTAEMVKTMAPRPIILALANPDPEISPEEVYSVCPDAVVGTGQSNYANQVNNLLCFPYIFRGAVDTGSIKITEEMKVACAEAISSIARKGFADIYGYYGGKVKQFGKEYFIPNPFDVRLLQHLPVAVARAAVASGASTQKDFCMKTYEAVLHKEAYKNFPALGAALWERRERKESGNIWYVFSPQQGGEHTHDLSEKMLCVAKFMQWYELGSPVLVASEAEKESLCQNHPEITSWQWEDYSSFQPHNSSPVLWSKESWRKDTAHKLLLGKTVGPSGFFWIGDDETGKDVSVFSPQERYEWISKAVYGMMILGYKPCLLLENWEERKAFHDMPFLSFIHELPRVLEPGCGYLWIPHDFPVKFLPEFAWHPCEIGGDGALLKPMTLSKSFHKWQRAHGEYELSHLVELAAFALHS